VLQFSGKHPELVERLPQKDLASHLNLSAETLCRLSRRCKAGAQQPQALGACAAETRSLAPLAGRGLG